MGRERGHGGGAGCAHTEGRPGRAAGNGADRYAVVPQHEQQHEQQQICANQEMVPGGSEEWQVGR